MAHKTVETWVRVDIDEGIAPFVRELQRVAGIRTFACCQGSLDQDGLCPPYVMFGWDNPAALASVKATWPVTEATEYYAYVHPAGTVVTDWFRNLIEHRKEGDEPPVGQESGPKRRLK